MARWEPGARDRLETAAWQLFAEQGFAATTVPEITARAGLTTRTFFRHFTDKRDVLFTGEQHMPTLVADLMAGAPPDLRPMPLISQGLKFLAQNAFEGRLQQLRARRLTIATDEGLQERELRKLSVLAEVITAGFRQRGVDELTSMMSAHLGVSVFHVAVTRWLDQDGVRPLVEFVTDTVRAVSAIASDDDARPRTVPSTAQLEAGGSVRWRS